MKSKRIQIITTIASRISRPTNHWVRLKRRRRRRWQLEEGIYLKPQSATPRNHLPSLFATTRSRNNGRIILQASQTTIETRVSSALHHSIYIGKIYAIDGANSRSWRARRSTSREDFSPNFLIQNREQWDWSHFLSYKETLLYRYSWPSRNSSHSTPSSSCRNVWKLPSGWGRVLMMFWAEVCAQVMAVLARNSIPALKETVYNIRIMRENS